MIKKVAILANGGDVSGFNAVIRAILRTAQTNGVECYGFIDGYRGLVENNYVKLTGNPMADGILPKGGSIIGSSTNAIVFHYKVEHEDGTVTYEDLSDKCVQNIKEDGFDCLFTLGGDSTQKSSRDLFLKGINTIGVPKTIDNDVACTEITFGYNTAVMVLEVMGRFAGWIALESAIAGGADVALIPEIPYDLNKAAESIKKRIARGKKFSVVVVSEGAKAKGGQEETHAAEGVGDSKEGISIKFGGIGVQVAKELEKLTGLESRCTVLGYMQRGLEGKFGVLTVVQNGKLSYVPLEEVVGNNKEIGAVQGGTADSNVRYVSMDDELLRTARDIGICLGD